MKVKRFDRPAIRAIREAMDEALAKVGRKFGISLKAGNASFSPDNFRIKVEGALLESDGTVRSREATEFERYADLLGLQKGDLGKTFMFRGQPYEIVGAKLSSRKYPILAKNRNGKVYKFQANDVRRLLPGAGKPLFGSVPVPPPPGGSFAGAGEDEAEALAS